MRRVSAGSQIVFTMTSECWKSHCLLFSGLGFETRYECRARPSLITKSIVALHRLDFNAKHPASAIVRQYELLDPVFRRQLADGV
jgi:hypothetical protein